MSLKSRIWEIRQAINVKIFESKEKVLHYLRMVSVAVATIVFGTVVYYYGFPRTDFSYSLNSIALRTSFVFFLLRYLLMLFYDFHPLKFIKERWFEGLILFIFFVDALSPVLFRDLLIFKDIKEYFRLHSLLIMQIYFLMITLWELRHTAPKISRLNVGPATLLVSSFLILIFGGTILLMLPEMTVNHHLGFVKALFTATSASCVTGLTVVDTGHFFTFKGQLIIMLLIQLGGINIISFAAFFATMSKKMGGLKYQSIVKDLVSADKLSDTKQLLRSIIKWSFIIEMTGSILLYFSWDKIPFKSTGDKIYYSVFHAISAFNNAGFSLFTDNLYQEGMQHMYIFQMIIAVLIILGGIGFFVLQDIFGINKIRERLVFRWKDYSLTTKINLRATLILLVTGMVAFYFLEQNGTMAGYSFPNRLITSFFQSVTARTAGFNTVDFSLVSTPMLVLFILLMFIGAGSGSTAGGVKMTTFAVAVKSSLATIRGKSYVDYFKRTIPFSIVNRAYSIIIFALTVISISLFLLTIFEPGIPFMKLAFEEFSAFGTVGLSTGITPSLSIPSEWVLILSMFTGRIGVLSIAMVLSRRVISRNFQYGKETVPVG